LTENNRKKRKMICAKNVEIIKIKLSYNSPSVALGWADWTTAVALGRAGTGPRAPSIVRERKLHLYKLCNEIAKLLQANN
jgi:hypothetical protein